MQLYKKGLFLRVVLQKVILMNKSSEINHLFRSYQVTTLGKKKQNLQRNIVSQLFHQGATSSPELSKKLNVSIPTMNRALTELTKNNIVSDLGPGSSIGGRRPNLYGINPDAGYVLAIDISRFSFRIALMNLSNTFVGRVIHHHKPLENNIEYIDHVVAKAIQFVQEGCHGTENLIGAGIAIPGLINPETGNSLTHFTFSEKPVRNLFQDKLGVPVYIDNDARMMTQGEAMFGLAKGKTNILCLNIGAGLGMGMILGGKIFQGTSGFAGEFGHIKMLDKSHQCYCGKNGCLETFCSGPALERQALEELAKGSTSALGSIEKPTYEEIIRAAIADDYLAIRLISDCGYWLGKGLATLIHLLNPEMIILGGAVSAAGNILLDPVNQSLNEYAISKVRREATILTSNLGDKAALYGAHSLVINNTFIQAYSPDLVS